MHPWSSLSRATTLAASLCGLWAVPATAHEFWIEPTSPEVEVGETVQADLRVGGMLSGEAYPYLSDRFVLAQLHSPGGIADIEGMEGDLPALTVTPAEPGLHVILYHAVPSYITYEDFETFANYLAYEGLTETVELHKARGLPEAGFTEAYVRNARSLIQVGPVGPADRDRPTGMPLELVALQNPFADGLEEVEVQLLWNGAPVPNRQVSVFRRAAGGDAPGEVTRSLVATDAGGRATIPIGEGGFYLLNAVQMKPASGPEAVVWESHWATLTFAVDAP